MNRLALSAFAAAIAASSPTLAFNSDEHKAIGDVGSSSFVKGFTKTPGVLPVKKKGKTQILVRPYQSAQAIDGQTRISGIYRVTRETQIAFKAEVDARDNARWGSKKSKSSNGRIVVPDAAFGLEEANPLLLWVGSADSANDGEFFTFGDLVSLYGDYWRAVTCDATRTSCLLTDGLDGHTLKRLAYLKRWARGEEPPLGYYTVVAGSGAHTADEEAWWADEMLRIASSNDWHFGDRAVEWYVGAHRLALLHAD